MRKLVRLGGLTAATLAAALRAQEVPLPPIAPSLPKVVFIRHQDEKAVNNKAANNKPEPAPLGVPPVAPAPLNDPAGVLEGPIVTEGRKVEQPARAPLAATDRPLAINLASALRLADARPLVIALSQARVLEAAARLERAEVLWVPNLNVGGYFYQHTGGAQLVVDGDIAVNSRNEMILGAGLTNVFALTDAIFEPLSARQVLRSREADVQAARNDVLLDVAEAYFSVQQARGRYAGFLDAVTKSRELVARVEKLAKNLVPELEVDRAKTLLAEIEQAAALARQDWRVSSATLTRLLRLDPAAVVMPLEPPHLQVTLISPSRCVDELIPIGLTSRPELASQQALVQATLERLRQERLRPLLPSILLTGNGTPQFFFNGGAYSTGRGANLDNWAGRGDVAIQFIWQAENLGFGNRGRIRERDAQNQQAVIDLFRVQDTVAAEVAQAHAQLEAAAVRVEEAARGLDRGLANYSGNLRGLSETTRFGDILQLVVRPQEAVAALQQLQGAYSNYFLTVGDYNRAQFRLYRAMGYPAQVLACERPAGPIVPVNPERPFHDLPPVNAPEPCGGVCAPKAGPAFGAVPPQPAAGPVLNLLPAPKAVEKEKEREKNDANNKDAP